MNKEKFGEFQLQMRQNHEDLQDYLRDLDSFTDEIKKKDDNLKQQTPNKSQVSHIQLKFNYRQVKNYTSQCSRKFCLHNYVISLHNSNSHDLHIVITHSLILVNTQKCVCDRI